MIRLLAVDIDGTLLDSQGHVPPAHRTALAEAVAAGVEVALVTGRSYHFTKPIVELLHLPLTVIVNNGAVVKNHAGGSEMRQLLSRDAARKVLERTGGFEESVALVFDRPDERQIMFHRMDWSHPQRRGYYERNKAFIAEASSLLAELLHEDPIQVMFNGSVEPMRRLAATLRQAPDAPLYTVAITEYEMKDFSLVDVNGAGCSKGTALARWARHRGLTRDAVMAIGDNFNDVEMLKFAGTAFVMGNAAAEVKALGYRITGTNDEGGLAAAVNTCVLDVS
jgi:Cof subfamily protein (haloacid dehalogenase superfamily)